MKKSLFASFVVVIFAIFCVSYQSCNPKPQPGGVVASDQEFTVTVGAEKYVIANEEIPLPADTATATRGPGDVEAATAYLTAVAGGTNSVVNIVDALKGKKLTTFTVWISLVPVLIPEIKPLVNSIVGLKNFNSLYGAAKGLTPTERAQVATAFSAKFSIPQAQAEKLTELLVESALVNMQVAAEIQALKKTK